MRRNRGRALIMGFALLFPLAVTVTGCGDDEEEKAKPGEGEVVVPTEIPFAGEVWP